MIHTRLAGCYFPTTAVFVDDSRSFVNGLKLSLNRRNADCCFFNDSQNALDFLQETTQITPFVNRCISRPEEQHKDHRSMDIDVSAIGQEVYNPNRFKSKAIIVIDYAMPGLNGLELSQKIKEIKSEYKIILLTGEADEKIAVNAFNKGLIQHFISKNSKDFSNQLNQAIHQLQLEYFQDVTEIILNSLTQNPDYPPSCLSDPVYIQFFNQFVEKHSFTEYYLIEESGSYLFLDFSGKPSWLVVKDQDMMEGMLFDAEHSDVTVSPDVLEALKRRTHFLHFNDDQLLATPENWKNYLFPAHKLEGKANYYYSLITEPSFNINQKKIMSYQSYLAQRKSE